MYSKDQLSDLTEKTWLELRQDPGEYPGFSKVAEAIEAAVAESSARNQRIYMGTTVYSDRVLKEKEKAEAIGKTFDPATLKWHEDPIFVSNYGNIKMVHGEVTMKAIREALRPHTKAHRWAAEQRAAREAEEAEKKAQREAKEQATRDAKIGAMKATARKAFIANGGNETDFEAAWPDIQKAHLSKIASDAAFTGEDRTGLREQYHSLA